MNLTVYGYINNPFDFENCTRLSDISFNFNLADYIAEDVNDRYIDSLLMDDVGNIEDLFDKNGIADEDVMEKIYENIRKEIISALIYGNDDITDDLRFERCLENGCDGYDYSFNIEIDVEELIEKELEEEGYKDVEYLVTGQGFNNITDNLEKSIKETFLGYKAIKDISINFENDEQMIFKFTAKKDALADKELFNEMYVEGTLKELFTETNKDGIYISKTECLEEPQVKQIAKEFEEFADECGEYEFGSGAKWFDYENYDCDRTMSKITNVLLENEKSPYGNIDDLLKYLEENKEKWQGKRHDMSIDEIKKGLEYYKDKSMNMKTISKDSNDKQKGTERG